MSGEIVAILAVAVAIAGLILVTTRRINDRLDRFEERIGLVEQWIAKVEGQREGFFGKDGGGGVPAVGE